MAINLEKTRTLNMRRLRDKYGSIQALANVIDKKHSQTSQWVHGTIERKDIGRNISTTSARMVEQRCGLEEGWLDTDHSNISAGPDFLSRRYPVISWESAANWNKMQQVPVDAPVELRACHVDLSVKGFILKIKDDAMVAPPGVNPSFPAGALIYAGPAEGAELNSFVVVKLGSKKEAVFRRLVLVDGQRYLEALNEKWPTRYIKLSNRDEIVGVVRFTGTDV